VQQNPSVGSSISAADPLRENLLLKSLLASIQKSYLSVKATLEEERVQARQQVSGEHNWIAREEVLMQQLGKVQSENQHLHLSLKAKTTEADHLRSRVDNYHQMYL